MTLFRASRFLIAPALLRAAALAGQDSAAVHPATPPPSCEAGAADEDGARMAFTFPGTVERAAEQLDAALRAQGYPVQQPPTAAGAWAALPSHTWRPKHEDAVWHGPTHPGLQLTGDIQPGVDSAEVTLLARALCRSEGGVSELGSADDLLERFSALDLMLDVVRRSGRPATPFRMQVPQRVGEFMFEGHLEDSSGVHMRYGAMNSTLSVSVTISTSWLQDVRCTPSCAQMEVQQVVADDLQRLSRIQATLTGMDALVPGASDRWQAGQYVTHDIVHEGRTTARHLYIYAFPGYTLLFRGFVDDSPGGVERVRAFVAAALASGFGSTSPADPRGRGR
ncbi:MAG TPA: hypothetical protein VHG08_05345 [Longimicrobium sp.]|nr:hypothetical protein [Longimicrobium sp.]